MYSTRECPSMLPFTWCCMETGESHRIINFIQSNLPSLFYWLDCYCIFGHRAFSHFQSLFSSSKPECLGDFYYSTQLLLLNCWSNHENLQTYSWLLVTGLDTVTNNTSIPVVNVTNIVTPILQLRLPWQSQNCNYTTKTSLNWRCNWLFSKYRALC